jgi:hypothetical protein
MQVFKNRAFGFATLGLLTGFTMSATQGCDDSPLGDIAEQCGLVCGAFVEGEANVSGLANVDAFFGAALEVEAAINDLDGSIRASIDRIALSLGLQAGASPAEIRGAFDAKFGAALDGGLRIDFAPPRCEASVEVMASAAASCDVEVDPGSVEFECSGGCAVEAGVAVDCGASAELRCTGTPPGLACEGECSGSCAVDVSAGASCEGTCNGGCDGTCSLSNAEGECRGECSGTCTGECEISMEAGASCEGKCQGSCEWTPPSGECDASFEAKCEAEAGASVECSGRCEGSAEAPSVSAECEASVEAKASASVECRPPTLEIAFHFSASADADVQAEFKAFLGTFRAEFAAILAARAKAEIIFKAFGKLSAEGRGAVEGAIDAAAEGDFKMKFGAACAIGALPAAITSIGQASTRLQGSITASADMSAQFLGG